MEIKEENLRDALKKLIEQVEREIHGLHSQTCGVSEFDYTLGAKEALDRLKDISGINKY
jgi:hypothetical protein